MVYITDKGSKFKAPVDKVWRLVQAHNTEALKIHPDNKNPTGEKAGENVYILTWENDMQGKMVKSKMRFTVYPPVGSVIEILEGPFAGSVAFNYYEPKGGNTEVNVVGEWKSTATPGDQLKKSVLSFLEKEFNDDTVYLKTMQ